jgi:Acetyltransferase (GNAT) domain
VKARAIDIRSISAADEKAWRALAERAVEPNPLYEPDCLIPAARHQSFGAEITLLVAEEADRFHACVPIRHVKRWHKFPYKIVTTQVRRMIYQGTPLVAADRGIEACATLLEGLMEQRRAGRSRVFALQEITGGGPVDAFFRAASAELGLAQYEFESFERGLLRRRDSFPYDDLHSTRTLSDMRRKHRRLADAVGAEPVVVDRGSDSAAVDDYIALESSGYKAEIGVALTTVEGETAFFRDMCARFGAAGRLNLIALEGDGQTLAMNVWIRGGAGIFMIKWSFDEKYARYSPGLQLHMDSVEHFHVGTDAEWIDSCTYNGNDVLMRLLPDRRTITSYFIMLEPGWKSWPDRLAMQSFIALRPWHKRFYERRHGEAARGAAAAHNDR